MSLTCWSLYNLSATSLLHHPGVIYNVVGDFTLVLLCSPAAFPQGSLGCAVRFAVPCHGSATAVVQEGLDLTGSLGFLTVK